MFPLRGANPMANQSTSRPLSERMWTSRTPMSVPHMWALAPVAFSIILTNVVESARATGSFRPAMNALTLACVFFVLFSATRSSSRAAYLPRAMKHALERIDGSWTIARLDVPEPIPEWVCALQRGADFVSITRTRDELSIVALDEHIPASVRAERGWSLWRVAGTIEFSEVGVLASIAAPLAAAGISCLAIATFDTDYLLVRSDRTDDAVQVLTSAGIIVR